VTGQSVGPVAIRLLGLYAVVRAVDVFSVLTRLGLVAAPLYAGRNWSSVILLALPFGLLLVLAYAFTVYPATIADRLLPQEAGALDLPAPLVNLAFVVAGVIIFSDALSNLTHLIGPSFGAHEALRLESAVAAIIQLAVGLLAILRPGAMTRTLNAPSSSAEQPRDVSESRLAKQLGALAFAAVGLVLLASALPRVLPAAIVYFVAGGDHLSPATLALLFDAVPKALLGLLLFLQPTAVTNLLGRRLFSMEHKTVESPVSPD
jgi:hypothetical protein